MTQRKSQHIVRCMAASTGDRLRAIRQSRGLSPRGLAAKSGVSHTTIWAIERGFNLAPRTDTLCYLAFALGVPVKRLWP